MFELPSSSESVPIPATNVNYKDILFKVFWTTVALAIGVLGTAIAEIHPGFAIPIGSAVNYLTALIRQAYGVTPPDLRRSG